jgi:Zn-dependent protease with chaperone function
MTSDIPRAAAPVSAGLSASSILGPEDRESFFEVQARDRRASWKLAVACVFGVLLMGSALVLTLAPPLVGVAVVIADIVNLFVPGTPNMFEMLMGSEPIPTTPLGTWFVPMLILLPGAVAALASWTIVSRLTLRSEVSSLLLHHATREPKVGDLEEQQLGNVVAEMAIAAGVEPPRLRLLDVRGMYAAAVGRDLDDAMIVVTRELLDGLDREETQAIIGHLVASVGNGDLRIAHYILTMYATVGLLERLPFVPLDPEIRGRMRTLVRAALSGDTTFDSEFDLLVLELYRSPGEDTDFLSKESRVLGRLKPRTTPRVTWLERLPKPLAQGLAWPLIYVAIAQIACRLALLGLLVNPLLALLWRRRRMLADASAVQLCRELTPLGRALAKLSAQNTPPVGDPFVTFLFPASSARGGWQNVGNFGGASAIFPAACLPDPHTRAARLGRMGAQQGTFVGETAGLQHLIPLIGHGLLVVLKVAFWAFCFTMACLALAAAIFVGAPMAFFLLLLGPHILLRGIIPWMLGV